MRETVALLKVAEMAPLDVTGYGTLADREAAGDEIPEEERALMRAPAPRTPSSWPRSRPSSTGRINASTPACRSAYARCTCAARSF